jgi:hypothetical protein
VVLAWCVPSVGLEGADPPEAAQVRSAVERAAAADCRSRSVVCWALTSACWACWRPPAPVVLCPVDPEGCADPEGKPEPLGVDAAVSTIVAPLVPADAVWVWLDDCVDDRVEEEEAFDELNDSPDSSWLSLAWAPSRLAWAIDTSSCRELMSRVARVWPAVTC